MSRSPGPTRRPTSSRISIRIAAPPELVFGLARDPLRWPALLPHYVAARDVVREPGPPPAVVATYVARRPLVPALGLGLPVAWRSRSWAEPAGLRLRFVHLGGATDGMTVTWTLEPVDVDGRPGCRVTVEHALDAPAPLARAIDRLFVRPIAGRTLATFRAISEAVAETIAVPDLGAPDAGRPPE